jgi:DNA-binding HxlR family transcriptional regulator
MTRTAADVRSGPEGARPCLAPGGAAEAVEKSLAVIDGRWKIMIIFQLFAHGVLRYSEYGRLIPSLSQRVLTKQLRALEQDGIVSRTVYAEVPPRVEYRLTQRGEALRPALTALRDWSIEDRR